MTQITLSGAIYATDTLLGAYLIYMDALTLSRVIRARMPKEYTIGSIYHIYGCIYIIGRNICHKLIYWRPKLRKLMYIGLYALSVP